MRPVAATRGHIYKPPPASGNGLLNNLVGYWGLDEAGGANNALDKHSGARTLTHTASPGSNTGKVYAGARTFNGSQYFTRTSETATQSGDNDLTWAAWVYLETLSANSIIIAKYDTSSAKEFILFYNFSDHATQNRFALIVSSDGSATTSLDATTFGAPSSGTWYFVCAWHDAANNQIGISVNNGTANTASYSSGIYAGSCPLQLGTIYVSGSPYGDYLLNGRMGPVMMWKSAPGGGGVLTSTQRTVLYNSGNGLSYASFTT